MGQWGVGEVRTNFLCWPTLPQYQSGQRPFAAKRVDNVCRHSPAFTGKKWRRVQIKDRTRSPLIVEVKAARVRLVDTSNPDNNRSYPTDRKYWLMVTRNLDTNEIKYFVSNAPKGAKLLRMLQVTFARDHIERWFRTGKQEAGFGAFEVRTYTSLIRHWLCSRLAMYFLATQTTRLRGEKSGHHHATSRRRREPVGQCKLAPHWQYVDELIKRIEYYQRRNRMSYESRRKTAARRDTS